jgi:hypothetical protein
LSKLLATMMVATLILALGAAPAGARGHAKHHAKPKHEYAYTATINCGRGNVTVESDEDLYAPLVDQKNFRTYFPIAWNVEVNGETVLQDEKPGVPKQLKRFAHVCSYTDGVATGKVTVLGPVLGLPN